MKFANQIKSTAHLTGKRESYNFDDEIEFVVDGAAADSNKTIHIEVIYEEYSVQLLYMCITHK